jgi:hypothetical protein
MTPHAAQDRDRLCLDDRLGMCKHELEGRGTWIRRVQDPFYTHGVGPRVGQRAWPNAATRCSSENRSRRRDSTSDENVAAICKQGELTTTTILAEPRRVSLATALGDLRAFVRHPTEITCTVGGSPMGKLDRGTIRATGVWW